MLQSQGQHVEAKGLDAAAAAHHQQKRLWQEARRLAGGLHEPKAAPRKHTLSSAKAEAIYASSMSSSGELLFPHFMEAVVHLAFLFANPGFTKDRGGGGKPGGGGGGGGGGGSSPERAGAPVSIAHAARALLPSMTPVPTALGTLLREHFATCAQQAAAKRQSEAEGLEVRPPRLPPRPMSAAYLPSPPPSPPEVSSVLGEFSERVLRQLRDDGFLGERADDKLALEHAAEARALPPSPLASRPVRSTPSPLSSDLARSRRSCSTASNFSEASSPRHTSCRPAPPPRRPRRSPRRTRAPPSSLRAPRRRRARSA